MSILSEFRIAMQTVGAIVTSALEAVERAKTEHAMYNSHGELLAAFEEMHETFPECTCQPCPLRDEDVCDEAEADEDEWEPMQCGVYPECDGNCCKHVPDSSAAVSAAADPSPTVPNAHSVVGDEGWKEDSCILSPASFQHPIVDETGGPR